MWATILLFVLVIVFAAMAGGTGRTGVEHYAEVVGFEMYPNAVVSDFVGSQKIRAFAYKMLWQTVNPYSFNCGMCTLLAWVCLLLGLARVLKGMI